MSTNDTYFLIPAHLELARARYFKKDDEGNPVEDDISEVFTRETNHVYQHDKGHQDLAWQLRVEKKIVPAGRPLAQAGTGTKNLCNCFVLGFEDDTKEAISNLKTTHMNIQAQGGGTGMNFSTLRPHGSICKTNQSRSSGAVGFMTDVGYQSANICQGGNRSGANMGCLEDWHPDLYDFIHHKSAHNWENIRRFATIQNEDAFAYFQWQNSYEWQTFNVSTMLSDAFMEQVSSDTTEPWTLHWKGTEWLLWDFKNPVGPKTGGEYEKLLTVSAVDESMARYKASAEIPFFNAQQLELVRGPYKLTAKEWFRKIAENAWEDGCPGIIFMDLARRFHNGEYFNPLRATNPCAEQFLPDNSVCALASLCLPSFYASGKFDWAEFRAAIHEAVRGLDNLTDVTKTGETYIDDNVLRERRIGLGTTGIGELLLLKGLRYDTEEARVYAAGILEFLRDETYRASIELAKERGPFPAFDYKGYSKSAFFKTLPKDIKADIKEFGIRNVTLLTQAPTGTTGTMVGYSQGCEPYFMLYFKRNSRVGTFVDGSPAFRRWLEERDIDYDGFHYDLKLLREELGDTVPDYFVEAQEIHWKDHLKMQAVFAKYVDSSVSKTINLPHDATVEDVEEAFLMAYKLGIKSTTIYRDGSKQQILEAIKTEKKAHRPDRIIETLAPSRPKKLLCDIHHTSVQGEKWTVLVGKLGKKPYEVFCAPQESFELSDKYKEGTIIRSASKKYDLDLGDFKLKNITRLLETDEHRVITRLLSMALRHGVPIEFMNEQLHKADGTVSDFSKAVLRILRKYQDVNGNGNGKINCQMCGSKNIVIVSGCPQCLDCNWSKCE